MAYRFAPFQWLGTRHNVELAKSGWAAWPTRRQNASAVKHNACNASASISLMQFFWVIQGLTKCYKVGILRKITSDKHRVRADQRQTEDFDEPPWLLSGRKTLGSSRSSAAKTRSRWAWIGGAFRRRRATSP
jgi:hypothetical protein